MTYSTRADSMAANQAAYLRWRLKTMACWRVGGRLEAGLVFLLIWVVALMRLPRKCVRGLRLLPPFNTRLLGT